MLMINVKTVNILIFTVSLPRPPNQIVTKGESTSDARQTGLMTMLAYGVLVVNTYMSTF